jgi:hypothetical protein
VTGKGDSTKSRFIERACQIPPPIESRTHSIRWLRLDLSSKRVQVVACTMIVLLFLTPLLLGFYVIHVNPPRGAAVLDSGEDTFVSTISGQDHSHEQFLRISNYSSDGENISETSFIAFYYTPPPSGGSLVDAIFKFHCGVVSAGEIDLHLIDSNSLSGSFETSLDNLTYSSMPSYEPVPFTALAINSNGSYSVRIFGSGGVTQEIGIIGLAITAQQNTQIAIDSFDGPAENRPSLTMYVTLGLMVQDPLVYYLIPVDLVPVVVGVVLLLIMFRKLIMQRSHN